MPVHFDIGIPLAISQIFSTMSEILTTWNCDKKPFMYKF